MFGTESQIDADFYRLIHRLAVTEDRSGRKNRRSSDRRPFFANHRIAPVRGEEFPEDSAFIPVRCYNLTRSGFSFFLPERPDFTRLVAAFGSGDEALFVGAGVIHCQDVLIHELGAVEFFGQSRRRNESRKRVADSGTPMVLVGCRFTERLEKPAERGQAGS